MDTDIDNYSNNEILQLLKLNNDDTLNVDLLFQRVYKTIDKLSKSDVDELDNILGFFTFSVCKASIPYMISLFLEPSS